ncbi:hypothetical protein HQ314_15580 [Rhodococcus sp. BP-332]|uniref:hypothetical protein n=1 Tax=Rhodococcus sp. BP-332 TaxID=2739447 RepID=UPI001C9A8D3B|nr:hypothetical protein [Rhodococcus sp. BP-332]MBY6678344.1 hypothetical protein [Rhodococcus sp. BP-332]
MFKDSLGDTPAGLLKRDNARFGSKEIESVREIYSQWRAVPQDFAPANDELWPLISHHQDVSSGGAVLRGYGTKKHKFAPTPVAAKDELAELVMHLVACTGVVFADPLRRLFYDDLDRPQARVEIDVFTGVVEHLAMIEEPIRRGAVHVSNVHPTLESSDRQIWLEPFGLGPSLSTLLKLIEVGYGLPEISRARAQAYADDCAALLRVCGIRPMDLPAGVNNPLVAIELFGRALMEVSWQLANVTESTADLYLANALERRIFEVLVEDCGDQYEALQVGGRREPGRRHLKMLASTGLPLFEPTRLSMTDVLDVRSDSTFTGWRSELSKAMDTYQNALLAGARSQDASAQFAEHIRSAGLSLARDAKKSSFKTALAAATVPMSVGLASSTAMGIANNSQTIALGAAVAGVSTAAVTLGSYLRGRPSRADAARGRFIAAFDLDAARST